MRLKIVFELENQQELDESARLQEKYAGLVFFTDKLEFDRRLTFTAVALDAYVKIIELAADTVKLLISTLDIGQALINLLDAPGAVVEEDLLTTPPVVKLAS